MNERVYCDQNCVKKHDVVDDEHRERGTETADDW